MDLQKLIYHIPNIILGLGIFIIAFSMGRINNSNSLDFKDIQGQYLYLISPSEVGNFELLLKSNKKKKLYLFLLHKKKVCLIFKKPVAYIRFEKQVFLLLKKNDLSSLKV